MKTFKQTIPPFLKCRDDDVFLEDSNKLVMHESVYVLATHQ